MRKLAVINDLNPVKIKAVQFCVRRSIALTGVITYHGMVDSAVFEALTKGCSSISQVKVSAISNHLEELLQFFPTVKCLDLSYTEYNQRHLAEELLPYCAQLEFLVPQECHKLSRKAVVHIACFCPNLLELDIAFCDNLEMNESDLTLLLDSCTKLRTLKVDAWLMNKMSAAVNQRIIEEKLQYSSVFF